MDAAGESGREATESDSMVNRGSCTMSFFTFCFWLFLAVMMMVYGQPKGTAVSHRLN